MASLYAEYLKERTTDYILENDYGFATYRFLDEGKTVYIIDIFIKPEHRKELRASFIADEICKIAKERGCTKLIGSVVPSAKNSTVSMKVLLGYGMSLEKSGDDWIIFRKEL